MHIAGRLEPEEFWERLDAMTERIRARFPDRPMYVLADWGGVVTLGEFALDRGAREAVHGQTDAKGDVIPPAVRVAVDSSAHDWQVAGDDALDWLARLVQVRRHGAHSWTAGGVAPDGMTDIVVDGAAVPFRVWLHDDGWSAGAIHEEDAVVVSSFAVDPSRVSLVRLDDIDPLLAAWRDRIRDARGEA